MSNPATTLSVSLFVTALSLEGSPPDDSRGEFADPPDSARPGVYWYFMDGNPDREGMTPSLLGKTASPVEQRAEVLGAPPLKSRSLTGCPACDREVCAKAEALWGTLELPTAMTERLFGKGRLFWGGELTVAEGKLYPDYDAAA